MEILWSMVLGLLAVLAVASSIFLFCMHIYGIVLAFKKQWYIGTISLLVPTFAIVLGCAMFIWKKDILNK